MQIRILGLAFLCTLQSACAGFAWAGHKTPVGIFYSDAATTEDIVAQKLGSKRGEACATSILGWVTTGNATASAAAKSAGIQTVSSVEHRVSNILGIYSKYCVQATGD